MATRRRLTRSVDPMAKLRSGRAEPYSRSMMVAMPCPKPMHIVCSP